VLRDGFDAKVWGEAWKRDLSSEAGIYSDSNDGARKMDASLAQDQSLKYVTNLPPDLHSLTRKTRNQPRSHPSTTQRPNKLFSRRTTTRTRDPCSIFYLSHDASATPAARLVAPLGSSSFSLPTVERAVAEMEGSSSVGCLGRSAGAPTSPLLGIAPSLTHMRYCRPSLTDCWTLKTAASPGTSAVSRGAATASGKPPATGPRTSSASVGGGASASGSQTDPEGDAGNGTSEG
jgi:dynein light intermediate chain 1